MTWKGKTMGAMAIEMHAIETAEALAAYRKAVMEDSLRPGAELAHFNEYVSFIAERSALPEVWYGYVLALPRWRPIETAPVDKEFDEFMVANKEIEDMWIAQFWYEDEGKYFFGTSGLPCRTATHWKPMDMLP